MLGLKLRLERETDRVEPVRQSQTEGQIADLIAAIDIELRRRAIEHRDLSKFRRRRHAWSPGDRNISATMINEDISRLRARPVAIHVGEDLQHRRIFNARPASRAQDTNETALATAISSIDDGERLGAKSERRLSNEPVDAFNISDALQNHRWLLAAPKMLLGEGYRRRRLAREC